MQAAPTLPAQAGSALPQPKTWLGILLMISGLWTLSMLDSTNKLLALSGYHVVMVAWIRYTSNTLLMAATIVPLYRRRTGKGIFETTSPRLQIARGCILLLSTLLFFSMLRIMPMAEATSLNFCAPLIVMAVDAWRRLLAAG